MEYYTISENTTFEIVEKRSKFIANLIYIENKAQAEEKIKELKKKYHDARHNCVAYRVLEKEGIYEKSSDDGEPSGTAGAPMITILKKNNLCNILIVVTRYFGGVLLGTGGLVRCYSGATLGAISKANKVQIKLGTEFEIIIKYADFQEINHYFQKNKIKIIQSQYEQNINCHVEIRNEIKEKFLEEMKNKNVSVKEINCKYIICK